MTGERARANVRIMQAGVPQETHRLAPMRGQHINRVESLTDGVFANALVNQYAFFVAYWVIPIALFGASRILRRRYGGASGRI